MFGRGKKKSRTPTTPEEIADRLPDRDDLVQRLDALMDALGTTRERVQDLSVKTGRRAGRQGRAAKRGSVEAARTAVEQARHAAERLPRRDEMVELSTKVGDLLRPERVAQRQAAARKRRWLRLGVGAAVLGGAAAVAARQLRGNQEVGPPIDMRPGVNGPVEPVNLDRGRSAGEQPANGDAQS